MKLKIFLFKSGVSEIRCRSVHSSAKLADLAVEYKVKPILQNGRNP